MLYHLHSEFVFELQYSSQFFDSLLSFVPEIKKLISSKTKLTIGLKIDENTTKSAKESQDHIEFVKIEPGVYVILQL